MNALSREALWEALQKHGLVAGEPPLPDKIDSPWYVRVMLGTAGWIGSLFLLGFVGVGFSFVMESAVASLIVGLIACAGAFALFKINRESDFLSQVGLAVGLVGQMLLMFGLYELFRRDSWLFYGSLFLIEVMLTIIMPSFMYRVMTSLAAAVSLTLALNKVGLYGIAPGLTAAGFALVWLQEARWLRFSSICRPVGYGLVLSLLSYKASLVWGVGVWWSRSYRGASWVSIYAPWLGKALMLTIFLAVVVILLRRLQIAPAGRAGLSTLAAASLVMAASFQVPGIVQAFLILIIGFAVCNRILMGLGLLAFVGFLSNYYYMMQSSLMVKSMLLLGLGALLLVSRMVMVRWISPAVMGGQVDA